MQAPYEPVTGPVSGTLETRILLRLSFYPSMERGRMYGKEDESRCHGRAARENRYEAADRADHEKEHADDRERDAADGT